MVQFMKLFLNEVGINLKVIKKIVMGSHEKLERYTKCIG